MEIIKPSIMLDPINGIEMLKNIERAGRTCYKSEASITEDSCKTFVQSIITRGHESVLEHEKITARIICDRGVTHEVVRHRIVSYSQESTRYVNYQKRGIQFIEPCFWKTQKDDGEFCMTLEDMDKYEVWQDALVYAETAYNKLISLGAKPEEARSVLPNSLKTEMVMTMNLREWRHFFRLRTSKAAHPQMRELANLLLRNFKQMLPIVFDDIVGVQ